MNAKVEYFEEMIGESLSEMGIFDLLTQEQKKTLARDIEISVDCMDMAFPQPSSRGYENSEISALKRRIKELESEVDATRLDFLKNIAMRRNCDISQITLEGGGHATIR